MIRVLIADDQALLVGALSALLDLEPDIEVVATCSSGDGVVEAVTEHSVDVALLDIEMPGRTGLEVAAELPCQVIIVTTFGRPGYLRTALETGAVGFVVKDTPPEQLAEAVRRAHAGLRTVDPRVAENSLFTPPSPLTAREVEVAREALSGAEIKEIAARLSLSHGTVRNHISAIMTKTGAPNRYAAARTCNDNGWL